MEISSSDGKGTGRLQRSATCKSEYANVAAEQPNEETGKGACGKLGLLLSWTLLAPEMERKKDMRQKKSQGMMHQSQDLTVPVSTLLSGISAPTKPGMWFILYPSSTSSHCHTNKVQQNHCNSSAEAFERFQLRHNWIRCGRCVSTRK